MGIERIFTCFALGVAMLPGGVALAAPAEPLIVTQLADPDPNFVPEGSHSATWKRSREAMPRLDASMEAFGRAIGQAALVEQQAIEERCRNAAPAAASATDRFAWAASCRYTRR